MSEKQKLEVRICGRDYTLVSEDAPEYVQRVAFYVDRQMRKVEATNPRLSISMSAILTALNISDQYLKEQEGNDRLKEELARRQSVLTAEQEKSKALASQLQELQTRYQALQIQYAKKETELEDALKNFELGLQNNNVTFDDLT